MSMYGDDDYGTQKNVVYYEMERFLEGHPVSELLEIVADLVECKEWEAKNKAESEAQE